MDRLLAELEQSSRRLLARTLRVWRGADVASAGWIQRCVSRREESLIDVQAVVRRFDGCRGEVQNLMDPRHPRAEPRARAIGRIRALFQSIQKLDHEIGVHLRARCDDMEERMTSTRRARGLARRYGPFASLLGRRASGGRSETTGMKKRLAPVPVRLRKPGTGRRSVLKGRGAPDGPPVAIGVPPGLGGEASVGLAGGVAREADVTVVVDREGRESLEVRCTCGEVHRIVLEYGEAR